MTAAPGIPRVHPLNFALKYNPPTIVLQYYLNDNTAMEFVHSVKLHLGPRATPADVVSELVREESFYFGSDVIPRAQVLLSLLFF